MAWASLPCTPCCRWQVVNIRSPSTAERIMESRRMSLKMIRVWCTFVKNLLREVPGAVVCFEWPRYALGWDEPAIRQMRMMLPWTAHIDGCIFGVRNTEGMLLLKPWQIVTNRQDLVGTLAKRCTKDHPHGVTNGPSATAPGYYTRALAQHIGEALVNLPDQDIDVASIPVKDDAIELDHTISPVPVVDQRPDPAEEPVPDTDDIEMDKSVEEKRMACVWNRSRPWRTVLTSTKAK